MSSDCHFPSNPDISGIGVRSAIYAQNLACFLPAISAIWDGEVSEYELESAETQATTNLILAFAILVSCIVQALTGGLTNYHTSIVLSLSWMNNTNVFIYFLLYVQYKGQPGMERVEPRWSAWATHAKKQVRSIFGDTDAPNIDTWSEEKGTAGYEYERQDLRFQARKVAKVLFRRITLVLGTFHLTLMAALGIWLWSDPRAFGTSEWATCATESAFLTIFGHSVLFGSRFLRVFSLIIYALFLLPGVNLLLPMALFLSAYFWHHRVRSKMEPWRSIHHQGLVLSKIAKALKSTCQRSLQSRVLPVYVGMIVLCAINVIFIVDIELTLTRNEHLQDGQPETEWGFGQILAVLLLSIPLRDIAENFLARNQRRQDLALQKERFNASFVDALYRGDCDRVVELVKKGVDPNTKTQDGTSALEVVTPNIYRDRRIAGDDKPSTSDWEGVRVLANANADLNIPFSKPGLEFRTVLQAACALGSVAGASKENLDSLPGIDWNNFHTQYGGVRSFEVVVLLLEKGADPHLVVNGNYSTALLAACKQGPQNHRAVEILLDQGVDVDLQGSLGSYYPWGWHIPGWPQLSQIPLLPSETLRTGTALRLACEENHVDIAKLLLDRGADVKVESGGDQPLRIACGVNGSLEMVTLLLDRGADPNFQGAYGTPLQTACASRKPLSYDVIKVLLGKGAKPNITARDRDVSSASVDTQAVIPVLPELTIKILSGTPLQIACEADSLRIVSLLLEKGADPNITGGNCGSALHAAIQNKSLKMVELLLKSGADPNIRDESYGTVLQAACLARPPLIDIVKLLLEHGADRTDRGTLEQPGHESRMAEVINYVSKLD